MRKVLLSGGTHNGRLLNIKHGTSVNMVSTGETYERPEKPETIGGVEVWKLVTEIAKS